MGGLNELSRHVVDGHVFIMWPVIGIGYLWNCGDINMGIDTGGPAFPREDYQANGFNDDNFGKRLGQEGMQLRDYFAAKAIAVGYSLYAEWARDNGFCEGWQFGVAMDAYIIADAMIKARNQ